MRGGGREAVGFPRCPVVSSSPMTFSVHATKCRPMRKKQLLNHESNDERDECDESTDGKHLETPVHVVNH